VHGDLSPVDSAAAKPALVACSKRFTVAWSMPGVEYKRIGKP
jgi:hypothetical protein